jgi:hypothetical protein
MRGMSLVHSSAQGSMRRETDYRPEEQTMAAVMAAEQVKAVVLVKAARVATQAADWVEVVTSAKEVPMVEGVQEQERKVDLPVQGIKSQHPNPRWTGVRLPYGT